MRQPTEIFFDLVMVCLHFLPDEIKNKLTFYLDYNILDGAFLKTCSELPPWFAAEFCYDPLYGQSENLRYCFRLAYRKLFLKRTIDIMGTKISLEITDELCGRFMQEIGITREQAEEWGTMLKENINEIETNMRKRRRL